MSDGVDFIKNEDEIKAAMVELNIKNILTGDETIVSSTTSINKRSPSIESYLVSEQTKRYREKVDKDAEALMTEYKEDLLLPYINQASHNQNSNPLVMAKAKD